LINKNDKVPPILNRDTLLALVQYIHSNLDRSSIFATNGLGEIPQTESSTINEHFGRNGSDLSKDKSTPGD
jgi:hypothetical protein